NCRALRTTEPMVVPSLKAGIATRTFDSGKARRKTAGTAVDASLSMFLATRQWGRRQGSQCFPPSPGRRNPGYKGFANIFKVGRKDKSFSLPVLHMWESYQADGCPRFCCHRRGFRSTRDRTSHERIGTVISPLSPCRNARGSSPSKYGPWGDWGKSSMPSKSIRTIANAPWGRKRYLLPLPILSVLLLCTALASPGVLRMTLNVFSDTNLTILASVQNVVHPCRPTGKPVGLMTVTNP